MKRSSRVIGSLLILGICLAACNSLIAGEDSSAAKNPSATNSPFLPTTSYPSPTDTPPATPTASPRVWISPSLPESFISSFSFPAGWKTAAAPEEASVRLEIGGDQPISTWIYALVAPFPTVVDGLSIENLQKAWSGQGGSPFAGRPLLMDQDTLEVFSVLWGIPAPGATKVVPAEALVDTAWSTRPAWGIVPWEALEPRWKVLEVDGKSPLRKEFDAATYPLAVPISCLGRTDICQQSVEVFIPSTNRDPSKLTTLMLTGVTALVRATAVLMESNGILYPAQDVGPLLQAADLTHVSNEIPFYQKCPPPDPTPGIYHFCSDPRYIDLLEYIGTDIVEMTGNHVRDYGTDPLLYTFELYRQRGWRFYASGENAKTARAPILVEHNGNRLAFIGCNRPGYNSEWATETLPGAAQCDFEFLLAEIRRLHSEGYLPIMTFQYYEYYHYGPTVQQVQEFRIVADAGAVIVSGSQAHHPQSFSFAGESFIHYGLGNLFFDQFDFSAGTNLAFIDRHVFYNGRYLGAELITIQFVDYARPRLMTPEERSALLTAAFSASRW